MTLFTFSFSKHFFKMEQIHQSLLVMHQELIQKENKIIQKERELKLFEDDLLELEDSLKTEKEKSKHCLCCRFNQSLSLNQPDTFYSEWGVFMRGSDNSETRLGVTSIGEVYLSQSFFNLFDNWTRTDIGKDYKNNKLVATYITKMDLTWSASDWRLVDDINSKMIICEKSGRHRIKFIIE